jgi:hypothetical protein
MAQPPKINNPAADPQLARYYQQIDQLTGRALSGDIDERTFRQELERLTLAAILLMFLLGGGDVSTPAGARALAAQQKIARESAGRLTGDIFDGRYSASDKQTREDGREKLQGRLVLWGVTLAGVFAQGQIHAPAGLREVVAVGEDGRPVVTVERGESRLVWRLGPTERHCVDCAGFDGQVKTAGEWAAMQIHPGSFDLSCHGFNCLCIFEEA